MVQPLMLLVRPWLRPGRLLFVLLVLPLFYLGAAVALAWPWVRPLASYLRPPKALVFPVAGKTTAGLESTWGAPRPGGRRHRGADLFAKRGTKVHSVTRGVVWKVGMDRLGGRVVTVLGQGPAFYYYAHLEDWAPGLRRGKAVEAGELLGFVGNSGNAKTTPPHLHFGVYRLGLTGIRATDPVPLLKHWPDPRQR